MNKPYTQDDGRRIYEEFRHRMFADPAMRAIYEEEAAKKSLWLQMVEARLAAGLTQAEVGQRMGVSQSQVARIEKRGYEAYTLTTLRRYVQALGSEFELRVSIEPCAPAASATEQAG